MTCFLSKLLYNAWKTTATYLNKVLCSPIDLPPIPKNINYYLTLLWLEIKNDQLVLCPVSDFQIRNKHCDGKYLY